MADVATRTLAILIVSAVLAACAERTMPVEIRFAAAHGDQPIACGDGSPALTDLRFYIHDVAVQSEQGEWTPLSLDSDRSWQQHDLVMIDLETRDCVNGTAEVNPTLKGYEPTGPYAGLRFTLGVPFDRNHADPLAAAPPLDDPAMHWHWRAGYKFLRAGVRTEEGSFWMHLGSTGCEGTVGDIVSCSRPNRVQVQLGALDPATDQVVFDLSALTDHVDLGSSESCASSPTEDSCRAPFTALGLDFETGATTGEQFVFVVRPQ